MPGPKRRKIFAVQAVFKNSPLGWLIRVGRFWEVDEIIRPALIFFLTTGLIFDILS